MGKGKRIKEKKQEEGVKLPPNYYVRNPDFSVFQRNLAAIDPDFVEKLVKHAQEGKNPSELIPDNPYTKILWQIQPAVIPMENNIQVDNLKNPLINYFIGFSTRKVHDTFNLNNTKKVKDTVIIEPDLAVFKYVLMTEDITDMLLNPRIEFLIGMDNRQLIEALFKFYSGRPQGEAVNRCMYMKNMEITADPFRFPGENNPDVLNIIDSIKQGMKQSELAMGCSDDQFTRWKMVLENSDIMLKAHVISDLYDKFKDVPTIVCGGGPSLEIFLDKAKKNPEIIQNSIIIAVDAVLKRLVDEGIKPHMVLRCERKLTNIFAGIHKSYTEGVYYVAYPWTQRAFFDLFDKHFYVFRHNGACMFTSVDHGFVDGGVSSGNAALELALNLGSKNIFLTGLDCATLDGKTHSSGTQVEFSIDSGLKKNMKVKCNDGKERKTIPVWERCLNEYGFSVSKHATEKHNVVNWSYTGAVIPGTTYKKIDDTLNCFKRPANIHELINKYKKGVNKKDQEAFTNAKVKALKELKQVKDMIVATRSCVEDAEETLKGEIDKIILQVQGQHKGYDLVKAIKQAQPSYDKLWRNVVDAYDINFKNKVFNMEIFRVFFVDVLQLDLFVYENLVNSTINQFKFNDQRFEAYCAYTKDIIAKIEYYANKLEGLLK